MSPRRLPRRDPIAAEFVVDAYHRRFRIEKSFRMSKHDRQPRPIHHHQPDSSKPEEGSPKAPAPADI